MDSRIPRDFPNDEPLSSNKTKFIVIGVFILIAIALAISGLVVAETKPEPVFQDSLVSGTIVPMILKSGDDVLYTYSLIGTPGQDKSNFSGYFKINITTSGSTIPNVSFRVEDDYNNTITKEQTIDTISTVPFKGVRTTKNIKLYADVSTQNQDLQSLSVFIN